MLESACSSMDPIFAALRIICCFCLFFSAASSSVAIGCAATLGIARYGFLGRQGIIIASCLYGDVAKACSLQKFGFSKLLNSCCAMSTSLAAHVLDMLAYVCHSMTFYDDGNDRSLVHAASSPCGHVAELKQLVGKSDWQGPSSHRGNHLFLHNNSSHNT